MKRVLKNVLMGVLLMGIMANVSLNAQAADRLFKTDDDLVVVIDPGHGGKQNGTTASEYGHYEKELNFITAQAMYDELSKYEGITVYMTRTKDKTMDLEERVNFAASVNADFLFSVHYNASGSHELYGTEIWVSVEPPYNQYGYQFGQIQMQTMQDYGLVVRGVKSRWGESDPNQDYYGIIRHGVENSIPTVIIEHCHVDNENDYPFCTNEEKWAEMGRKDAESVAKYFGLKSKTLGVDYSDYNDFYPVDSNKSVAGLYMNALAPKGVSMYVCEKNPEAGTVTLHVSYDHSKSMVLYYSISTDGGETFSKRLLWEGADGVNLTSPKSNDITVKLPSQKTANIAVKLYNRFDTESEVATLTVTNDINYPLTYGAGEDLEAISRDIEVVEVSADNTSEKSDENEKPETADNDEKVENKENAMNVVEAAVPEVTAESKDSSSPFAVAGFAVGAVAILGIAVVLVGKLLKRK